MPALAASAPHSGTPTARTHPELSDLALFAAAVFAIWFVRRALRRRFKQD